MKYEIVLMKHKLFVKTSKAISKVMLSSLFCGCNVGGNVWVHY